MDLLERDIYRNYYLKYGSRVPGWAQSGGDSIKSFNYNSHRIKYKENINAADNVDILIFGGYKSPSRFCFLVSIPPSGIAQLQILRRGSDCFLDAHESSKDVVRAAVKIAKEKGAKVLELVDESYINCPQYIDLPDLSMLTTGKTWYESILPFRPLDPEYVEPFRKKLLTNKWIDIAPEGSTLSIHGIDVNAPGSAMLVLNRAKKSKEYCKFFSDNMKILLDKSNVKSFVGTVWSYIIP